MPISFRKGFTLVEIMIVVAVLAIILAVAIPSYLKSSKASQKTVCIANLQRIDSSVDQWAIENYVAVGTVLSDSDEESIYNSYVKGGKPKCPSGGEYAIHEVGASPQVTCSHEAEGHRML